jgi:hypothetical protein
MRFKKGKIDLFLFSFIFLFILLGTVSAGYSNCEKYGNCKPVSTEGFDGILRSKNLTLTLSTLVYSNWTGQVNFTWLSGTYGAMTDVTYENDSGTITSMMDDGLVLALNFDNVTGLTGTNDNTTCRANYGLYQTCPTLSNVELNTSGRYGGQNNFKGSGLSNHIYYANLNATTGQTSAFSLWMKLDYPFNATLATELNKTFGLMSNTYGAWNDVYFGQSTSIVANEVICMRYTNTTGVGSSAMNCYVNATENFLANTWYHYLFAWNGSDYNIYVNGVKKDNFAYHVGPAIPIASTYLLIGRTYQSPYYPIVGSIDEFRLWNMSRALFTASDVKAIYNSNLARVNSTYWSFNSTDTGTTNDVCRWNSMLNECFQTPTTVTYSATLGLNNAGKFSINTLTGAGNAFLCVDNTGAFYRSGVACV